MIHAQFRGLTEHVFLQEFSLKQKKSRKCYLGRWWRADFKSKAKKKMKVAQCWVRLDVLSLRPYKSWQQEARTLKRI